MSTIYEHSAGIVTGWVGTYGNADMKSITEDIVEILRICHEYRTPDDKKVPVYDADDLGEAICAYLNEIYSSPEDFSRPTTSDEVISAEAPREEHRVVNPVLPPELDIPDQH